MLTSPNQAPSPQTAAPQQSAAAPEDEYPDDEFDGPSTEEKLQMLDDHLNNLPPEVQKQFEDGFRKYDDLPELYGILLPEAYEYFKMVQQVVRQPQAQQNPPAAGAPASPAGGQQQPALLDAANTPAKATSAFAGMA